MKQGNITLISFGYFEYELLEKILNDVENEFSVQVRTKEGFLDLTEYYDPSRNQYDGNKLLKIIDLRFVSDNEKILGLFNVDLFIPILHLFSVRLILTGVAVLYPFTDLRMNAMA